MDPETEALKKRTKRFALDVLDFVDMLPTRGSAVRIGNQLTDSATSVAANYRAACRSRSDAEFASKIGLVLEEADESLLWLELSTERKLGEPVACRRLLAEADELTAIFVASTITARKRIGRREAATPVCRI